MCGGVLNWSSGGAPTGPRRVSSCLASHYARDSSCQLGSSLIAPAARRPIQAVPLYRSVHFYFAHRFIHIRWCAICGHRNTGGLGGEGEGEGMTLKTERPGGGKKGRRCKLMDLLCARSLYKFVHSLHHRNT